MQREIGLLKVVFEKSFRFRLPQQKFNRLFTKIMRLRMP